MPAPTQGPGYTGPGDISRPDSAYQPQPWYKPSTADPALFEAQQTLAIDYNAFDSEINSELAKLGAASGGLNLIARWKATKAEFEGRNGGPGIPTRNMSKSEIADSRSKLSGLRAERDSLIGFVAIPDTGEKWIPDLDSLIKPSPGGGLQQTITKKPAAPVGPAPAGAGLFGLSRGATIGLGVAALAALGGGIYLATREDPKDKNKLPGGLPRK